MRTYANQLSCKYEGPQPAFQMCWWQTWHHRARRKGRSWSLVLLLPFRQKDTSAIAAGGHPANSWPGTAACEMDWCRPRYVQHTQHSLQPPAVGLLQFFVIPCKGLSHQAFEKGSLVSLKQHSSHDILISGWVACLQSQDSAVQWFPLTATACSHRVLFLWQIT